MQISSFKEPKKYLINRNFIIPPKDDTSDVTVIKGPNIKEISVKEPLKDMIEAEVLLKLGDNITTDDIMPAGSAVLPYRSNIPAISEFVFTNIDSIIQQTCKGGKDMQEAELSSAVRITDRAHQENMLQSRRCSSGYRQSLQNLLPGFIDQT